MDSLQTLVQERLPRGSPRHQTPAGGAPGHGPTVGEAAYPGRSNPRIAGESSGDGGATTLVHGRYRLLERLGAGGFGVVWRAHDEMLRREVALKRVPLPPDLLTAPGSRELLHTGERATREALACARLTHPAIVALHEAYMDDDAFYLVSELVEGSTLAQLEAEDALSDEELLEIGIALADALAHAHARGVIHRDVKPQNVLVPHDPTAHETPAKLADFGGASLSGEDALTRTGETLGTLAYMAPEQSEGRDVDELADVYSLALVVYEGLAGVNPVRGPTPAATARRIGRSLPPLAARRPDLSRTLVQALDTALAVDPTRRGTLTELRDALEQALAEGPTPRRGLLRPRSASPRREHPADTPDIDEARDVVAPASHRIDPDRHAPALDEAVAMDGVPALSRRVVLPRAVWLGCVLALAAWQVASARPGVALLLLTACAPVLLLGSRLGVGWLTCMLAPVLGIAGLAGAYPAIAGQATRWTQRAALGALGYWWLALAGPLLAGGSTAGRLWLPPPAGLPPRAIWEGSLDGAATHAVAPALTTGVLFGAALWATAAVVLPWLVRGRSALLDTLTAVFWSAVLLAATPYFDAGAAGGSVAHPRGIVLGAILGAAIAIAARALRGPVSARHP